MLTIDLGTTERYDEDSNQFKYEKLGTIRFEYSLKVMYDWEFKWRKPFLRGDHSEEELLDFYKMMAIDPITDETLTTDVMVQLSNYIADPGTATTFSSFGSNQNDNIMARQKNYTAEELYALMFEAQVPLDFEERNLNRLLVILRIISNHNNPPKKMTQEEVLRQNQEINRQRREELKTRG